MKGVHQVIDLSRVRPRSGGRDISKDNVKQLMASMKEMGLLQPITVIKARVVSGASLVDGYEVIAGRHRYCAAVDLNWREVPAIVLDADTDIKSIELIEIDENLCRAELTPAQRAGHIKRRKEIWEALHPSDKPAQTEPVSKGGRGNTGFASETAEVSGASKASVNRNVARAEALGDDINEVVGTSLDKGVELDALAKKTEPERKELIERAKAGEKVSARATPAAFNGDIDGLKIAWFAKAVSGLDRRVIETCGATIEDMVSHIQDHIDDIDPAVLDQIAEAEQDLYALYQLTQTIREQQGEVA